MNGTHIELTILEDPLNDAEIYLDEDILSEDCKCESVHKAKGNKICSGKVTHRLTWDCRRESHLVCWNQFRYTTSKLHGYHSCWSCLRPTEECWSIRPV